MDPTIEPQANAASPDVQGDLDTMVGDATGDDDPSSPRRGRRKGKKGFQKRSFNLPHAVSEKFKTLGDALGAATDAEVLRHVLKVYLYIFERAQAGDKIVIISKTDGSREVLNPIL